MHTAARSRGLCARTTGPAALRPVCFGGTTPFVFASTSATPDRIPDNYASDPSARKHIPTHSHAHSQHHEDARATYRVTGVADHRRSRTPARRSIYFNLDANEVQYTWHADEYVRSDGPDDDGIESALSEWELEEDDERLRQLKDRWAVLELVLPRGCKCGERLLYERDYGIGYRTHHAQQRQDSEEVASEAQLEAELGDRFEKWSNGLHVGQSARVQHASGGADERDQQRWTATPSPDETHPRARRAHAREAAPPLDARETQGDREVARLRRELAEQKERNRNLDDRLKLIEQQQSTRIVRNDSMHSRAARRLRPRAVAELSSSPAFTNRSSAQSSPSFNELSSDLTWDTMDTRMPKAERPAASDSVHRRPHTQTRLPSENMYTHGTDRLQPQWHQQGGPPTVGHPAHRSWRCCCETKHATCPPLPTRRLPRHKMLERIVLTFPQQQPCVLTDAQGRDRRGT